MIQISTVHTIAREELSEFAPHEFAIEASTAGLPVGQAPRAIRVPGLGNGRDLILQRVDEDQLSYRQAAGCVTLAILND